MHFKPRLKYAVGHSGKSSLTKQFNINWGILLKQYNKGGIIVISIAEYFVITENEILIMWIYWQTQRWAKLQAPGLCSFPWAWHKHHEDLVAPTHSKLLAGYFPDFSRKQQSFYVLFLRELPKAKKIGYVSSKNRLWMTKYINNNNNK